VTAGTTNVTWQGSLAASLAEPSTLVRRLSPVSLVLPGYPCAAFTVCWFPGLQPFKNRPRASRPDVAARGCSPFDGPFGNRSLLAGKGLNCQKRTQNAGMLEMLGWHFSNAIMPEKQAWQNRTPMVAMVKEGV
jgi:hypothetical protein